MILASLGIIAGKGAIPLDSDALAFITAASITDSTQKSAINQLVLDLKSANIWTKMKAIYPFVGGTASSHRFNLKAPTTNTSDFYLTFTGGWTHSSTGALPDGTSGYADTFLSPQSVISQNSAHVSYYSRTNTNSGFEIGARYPNTNPSMLYIGVRTGGNTASRINNIGTEGNVANTDGKGFYVLSRTGSSNYASFKNNTKTTITQTSQSIPAQSITLGAYYENAWYYGSKEAAFASIGDGLSDSEATSLYNAVVTFNTTLGRNV